VTTKPLMPQALNKYTQACTYIYIVRLCLYQRHYRRCVVGSLQLDFFLCLSICAYSMCVCKGCFFFLAYISLIHFIVHTSKKKERIRLIYINVCRVSFFSALLVIMIIRNTFNIDFYRITRKKMRKRKWGYLIYYVLLVRGIFVV
jgi:hypothetical protein